MLEPHVRREAALVAHVRAELMLVEHVLEMVENLHARAQRFAEGARDGRQDHELLDAEVIVGVLAAVEDIHHRCGERNAAVGSGRRASEEALVIGGLEEVMERRLLRLRGGSAEGHRYAQDRVRAELGFVFGAVELEHDLVDGLEVGFLPPARLARWDRARSRPPFCTPLPR